MPPQAQGGYAKVPRGKADQKVRKSALPLPHAKPAKKNTRPRKSAATTTVPKQYAYPPALVMEYKVHRFIHFSVFVAIRYMNKKGDFGTKGTNYFAYQFAEPS